MRAESSAMIQHVGVSGQEGDPEDLGHFAPSLCPQTVLTAIFHNLETRWKLCMTVEAQVQGDQEKLFCVRM